MKRVVGVLTLFVVIGLLGWAEDTPHPAPLVTDMEARSSLPVLRLPSELPEGVKGPIFTFHFVQDQPVVTLHYSYTPDGQLFKGFQIQEAPPALRDALHPRPITQMDARISLGLVGNVSQDNWPAGFTIEPREEIREGYGVSVVSGTRCLDALCEAQEPYIQAMTCDQELCAQIEGPLEEEMALQVLLSLFAR